VDVVAAVDVGGTRIKAALVDRSLSVLARTTTATPPDIGHDIAAGVSDSVRHLSAGLGNAASGVRLVGCGVVVPGLVDESTGTGLLSVNLGWRDLPIRAAVEASVGVPITTSGPDSSRSHASEVPGEPGTSSSCPSAPGSPAR